MPATKLSMGSSCGVTGPICWISAAPASEEVPLPPPPPLPLAWLPATPWPLPKRMELPPPEVTPRNAPPDSARWMSHGERAAS